MRQRCPDSRPVVAGRLSGYRLGFTRHSSGWNCGVADVVPCDGREVWGLLYELSPSDLDLLDQHEGYPHAYSRFQTTITTNGRSFPLVWVYSVREKESFIPPSRVYLAILKRAAREHGFPDSYLCELDEIPMMDSNN
jgi:gamma-glutamylcyclotransferase (GGCT)/AIG2-like uncharacterized protein YtfP